MKQILSAGFLLTLPGLLVLGYIVFFRPADAIVWGALASVLLNLVPFAIGYWMLRGRDAHSDDEENQH